MRRQGRLARLIISVSLSIILTLLLVPIQEMRGSVAFALDDEEVIDDATLDNEEHADGGIDESAPVLVSKGGTGGGRLKLRASTAMPSKYDSREHGNVTPVRDQGALSICWSFATIAAIESSLLAHGQVSSPNNLDLSERQLAYFSYNLVPDALGNTKGDKNIPTNPDKDPLTGLRRNNYIENAGNAWITTETLASGIGVINEKSSPSTQDLVNKWDRYEWEWSESFNNATKLNSNLARGANAWSISSVRRIPVSQKDKIKKAIIEYGGVAVLTHFDASYVWDSKNKTEKRKYKISWNPFIGAYYNYGEKDSTHLVTIVGWDDNYNKNNFRDFYAASSKTPGNNGAWLVKNSWGKNWPSEEAPDKGYYWISYEDCYFTQGEGDGDATVGAYAFEMRPASKKEILYQYDGSASECYNLIQSGGSIANMFKVAGANGNDEVLQSVSLTMLNDVDVNYSIQVYTDCTNPKNPTSGKKAFTVPQTGRTSDQGVYTITLNKKVPLKAGSKFAVVATLSHDNPSQQVKYDVDATSNCGNWVHFESTVAANQSFERDRANASWDDLSSSAHDEKDEPRCAARVKAISVPAAAQTVEAPKGKVTILNTIANSAKKTNDVIWDKSKVTGATHYEINWKARGASKWASTTVGNTVRGVTNGLTIGQLYEIRVRPKRIVGSKSAAGNWSNTVYRYFHTTQKIRLKSASKGSFTMSWAKNNAATSYQVMFTTNKNGKGAANNIKNVGKNATSYTQTGLKSGVTYYVQVREIRRVGNTNYIGNISCPVAVKVK